MAKMTQEVFLARVQAVSLMFYKNIELISSADSDEQEDFDICFSVDGHWTIACMGDSLVEGGSLEEFSDYITKLREHNREDR